MLIFSLQILVDMRLLSIGSCSVDSEYGIHTGLHDDISEGIATNLPLSTGGWKSGKQPFSSPSKQISTNGAYEAW